MDRREFLIGASALVFAPRPRVAGPVALVTADLESRLVAVDLPGGHVRAHVHTLAFPRSIERVGGSAVVAHSHLGAVTLVDGPSLEVRHVLHGFGEPRYTAGHPDGRHAYVTDAARGEVAALDLVRGRLLARSYGDAPPQHVSFAGGLAFVTSGWSGTLRVHRLDGTPLERTVVPVGSYNVQQTAGWVVTPALGRGLLTVCDEPGRVRRSERIARSSHDACVVSP